MTFGLHTSIKLGFIGALACASAAYADSIEKRAPADARGEVVVGNTAGSVRVQGWDQAEVEVKGDLGNGVERLDFNRDGERTVVKVVLRRSTSNGEADLLIHVPRDSRLVINTVSADVVVEQVRGAQRLQTVSGEIETQVWGGEFEAKTVSGEVMVSGQNAKDARTGKGISSSRITSVSGDISASNLAGELDFDSVSGDMLVTASQVTRARLKTTNGDVRLTSPLAVDARVEAESINGELSLDLKGVSNAEFEIETMNGDIENCFGPKVKRTRDYGPGSELRFKEGDGSAQVRVKTLSGDIRLCR